MGEREQRLQNEFCNQTEIFKKGSNLSSVQRGGYEKERTLYFLFDFCTKLKCENLTGAEK